jgi:hypothetical protein
MNVPSGIDVANKNKNSERSLQPFQFEFSRPDSVEFPDFLSIKGPIWEIRLDLDKSGARRLDSRFPSNFLAWRVSLSKPWLCTQRFCRSSSITTLCLFVC